MDRNVVIEVHNQVVAAFFHNTKRPGFVMVILIFSDQRRVFLCVCLQYIYIIVHL